MRSKVGPVAAAMALAWLGGAADAAERRPGKWVAYPSDADFVASWPEAAKAKGLAGSAAMTCRATADGSLTDCVAVRETPPNHGFAAALIAMAPKFRLRAATEGDAITVGAVFSAYDQAADWLRKPRPEDILAVYPKDAMRRGLSGKGIISCAVTVQGALIDCVVLDESPKGSNFGLAAIAMTPQLLMRPARKAGQPVMSGVSIPFNFVWPGGGAPVQPPAGRGVASPVMVWDEAPSYAQVKAAYPAKAAAAKVGGRATVGCTFEKDGRLGGCDVLGENPKGQGFGAAARGLAKQFRAFTATPDGKGVKGIAIQVAMVFDPAMSGEGQPVVGQPKWAGLPSREEMVAAFKDLKLEGTLRAVLSCTVAAKGTLADCRAVSQSPDGKGVAAAALSLTPKFRLTTWTAEGLPTIGGVVQIPIRYEP